MKPQVKGLVNEQVYLSSMTLQLLAMISPASDENALAPLAVLEEVAPVFTQVRPGLGFLPQLH